MIKSALMTAAIIGAFCGGYQYAGGQEARGVQCVSYKHETLTHYKTRELPRLPARDRVQLPTKAFAQAIPASVLGAPADYESVMLAAARKR